jgi:AcrR family transcriptional regulator
MIVHNPRIARSRDLLVNAALVLLDAGAGRIPTITEISERAGVSRPTFYQHYGDLSTLIGEASTRRLDAAFATVVPHPAEQTMAQAPDVIRGLVRLLVKDKQFYHNALNGPAGTAVRNHITAYVAGRLLTVSPFAGQLQAADGDQILFLAAGTTHLLTHHLFEDDSIESTDAIANRVANALTIAAAAFSDDSGSA